MKKITITFPDNSSIQVENEIRPVTLMNHFADNGQKILACRVNNEVCPLDSLIDINASIEPVYENTKEGAAIYRRSLCFLLAVAAHNLFPDARLLVGHSLDYGYYYTLDREEAIGREQIEAL
jgi:uridine kinase